MGWAGPELSTVQFRVWGDGRGLATQPGNRSATSSLPVPKATLQSNISQTASLGPGLSTDRQGERGKNTV